MGKYNVNGTIYEVPDGSPTDMQFRADLTAVLVEDGVAAGPDYQHSLADPEVVAEVTAARGAGPKRGRSKPADTGEAGSVA